MTHSTDRDDWKNEDFNHDVLSNYIELFTSLGTLAERILPTVKKGMGVVNSAIEDLDVPRQPVLMLWFNLQRRQIGMPG